MAHDIAQALRNAFSSWTPFDDDRSTAQDVLNEARDKSGAQREVVMLQLANTSATQKWEPGEVRSAVKQIKAAQNKNNPTLNTFMSEVVAVSLPHARERAAALLTIIKDAFAAEKDNDGKDKPCRKAFSRVYKAWVEVCRMAGRNEDTPHNVAEFVALAKASDPDLDYEKVAKRLARIQALLAGFAQDFPVTGFASIDKYLDAIDEKALKAARAAKLKAEAKTEADRMASHRLADVPVHAPAETIDAPIPEVVQEVEPAQGVVSLDEQLEIA